MMVCKTVFNFQCAYAIGKTTLKVEP